jgi:hypothetical protein
MKSQLKWTFLHPQEVDPAVFGLSEILALKVARYRGDLDVRLVSVPGWKTFADLLDWHPVTGKKLETSQWFIFAAKGGKKNDD